MTPYCHLRPIDEDEVERVLSYGMTPDPDASVNTRREIARRLFERGWTGREVADLMGMTRRQIERYRRRIKEDATC